MGSPVVATPRVLRPYQVEAVAAVQADWQADIRRVGVVLPTGAGKSTVIATLAASSYHLGLSVIMLAHRGELLDQMLDAVRAVDPTIPESELGIVRAEHDDHHASIVAATLQTLAHVHRRQDLGRREVILWDEVHHAGAAGYHTTFSELGGYDQAFMCGFTATMYREPGQGHGLGEVIQKISYEKDLRWAIEQGYLIRPRGLTVRIAQLNALNDVRTVAGDFHNNELAEVMEAATEYVVDAITAHAADRQMIVFAASVDAVELLTDALVAAGIAAEGITGRLTMDERQPTYARFRSGVTRALVTVMVLTEGADFPMCDCVVLARPTRSKNLYSQMVGRALRLWEGKTDALVLDLSGSSRMMRLVNLSHLDTGSDIREVDEDGNEIEEPSVEYDEEDLLDPTPKLVRQGPVELTTIDLLTGDDTLWLETPKGIPFIPLRDNLVAFIWPDDDREEWAVGWMNTRTGHGAWADITAPEEPLVMPLTQALEACEEFVVENLDQALPSRNASWRRNQPPSDGQLRMARRLKVVGAEQMTKARVSDEISIALAARVLDRAL
ncbi:DNA helicase [Gordonia phage Sour]|uniref:DNA helicase n=1 Tax=Gordonia phage Sour TaxID=2182349 RepID=A0A2U8UL93_9CAUD|nr:DNA helicase [Gordonia phage Sour]AWN04251.1 DNA helicase [Gordonia phage Sour]